MASSRSLQAFIKVSPSLSSTIQSFWQLPCCPPLIQILKFCHIKIDPQIPKIFPPYTQITPSHIKFLPLTRISLPVALMYSQVIEHLPPHIKSKPQHIKAPSPITKLQCLTTTQIPTQNPSSTPKCSQLSTSPSPSAEQV